MWPKVGKVRGCFGLGKMDMWSAVLSPWFPASRRLFSFAFAGLKSTGKGSLPWVETRYDPTAVHNLGRHSSNRMPRDMFADCDLSLLYPVHCFTVIPLLLSEPTQHEVSCEDSVAK